MFPDEDRNKQMTVNDFVPRVLWSAAYGNVLQQLMYINIILYRCGSKTILASDRVRSRHIIAQRFDLSELRVLRV